MSFSNKDRVMAFVPLQPGTILSKRYKIVHLIRQGGMGATYRAEDLEIHKPVAVKQLLDTFESPGERESGIDNFLSEMALLKSIEHTQIPKIFDHFISECGFFFVLEFVNGSDFTKILEDTGRRGLPEEEVIHAGIHLCRILNYLHGHKPDPIIHRDIKSSNIMKRSGDGGILLLDFGIARAHKPKEGMMIGTPGYASPEQHINETDPRSDIYSLGATLHELSTGLRPDPESFEFLSPHDVRAQLSSEFSKVILTATRYRPDDRFQSSSEFERALQSLLQNPLPAREENAFQKSLLLFQREILVPRLSELKTRYPNECQNESLPRSFEHLSFTLGVQVPHTLIVDVDHQHQSVAFYMKEGMLSQAFLGRISPADPEASKKLTDLLSRYEAAYIAMQN